MITFSYLEMVEQFLLFMGISSKLKIVKKKNIYDILDLQCAYIFGFFSLVYLLIILVVAAMLLEASKVT